MIYDAKHHETDVFSVGHSHRSLLAVMLAVAVLNVNFLMVETSVIFNTTDKFSLNSVIVFYLNCS